MCIRDRDSLHSLGEEACVQSNRVTVCLLNAGSHLVPVEGACACATPLRERRALHGVVQQGTHLVLSLIHISEPTRRTPISYAVFCLKKKKKKTTTTHKTPNQQ